MRFSGKFWSIFWSLIDVIYAHSWLIALWFFLGALAAIESDKSIKRKGILFLLGPLSFIAALAADHDRSNARAWLAFACGMLAIGLLARYSVPDAPGFLASVVYCGLPGVTCS